METFFFTQCACVLFDRAPSLRAVARALAKWGVTGQPNHEGAGEDAWAVCGRGYVIELRSGAVAVVDVIGRPWPDPAAVEATPALASAFALGAFGPGATPAALSRAADQPWLWSEGEEAAKSHGGFVRLRIGYAVPETAPEGGPPQAPADRDPVYELMILTELAQHLMRAGSLAMFVPAGEALRSRKQVDVAMSQKAGLGSLPPFELWSNVRAVALCREGDRQWLVLDVVGMGQLGLPDHEAIFAEGEEAPEAVDGLLRNACVHLLARRPIPPGSTADDARGRRWRASLATGIVAPARPVLRWMPEASARPSEETLRALSSAAGGRPSGEGT